MRKKGLVKVRIFRKPSRITARTFMGRSGIINIEREAKLSGGVNRKTEGFFDVCRLNGLSGEQGVLIPRANLRNLMLRDDLVEAVREGKFHIYAVSSIDEGIEILTGMAAGRRMAKAVIRPHR
jgi:predicted ATP-dependent protease